MSGVRDIEVRLGGLEDNILFNLGYREYEVMVGDTVLSPSPEVIQKSVRAYSDGQMQRFIDALGGQGNPIAIFEVAVSRLISEATIRSYEFWTVTRAEYSAQCQLVDLKVEDARYMATLGVLKIVGA